jgi:hypothetical protein
LSHDLSQQPKYDSLELEIKGGFSCFLKEGWKNFWWGASGTTERASAGV